MKKIKQRNINKLSELVDFVSDIGKKSSGILVFRGEKKDYGKTSLIPLVYRDGYINKEDSIYRESQRFNDQEFRSDKSTFDKISRVQHYTAPTRLIDVSEDLFSAIYFSIADKKIASNGCAKEDSIIYIFEIDNKLVKYYDSDTVSVISNLAKIPLKNRNKKSKSKLLSDVKKYRNKPDKFRKKKSVKYLNHEIREEKPQFKGIIKPDHITSIQFVWPKLTSDRIKSQKGAFLLFGLNPKNCKKPIKLIKGNKLINSNNHVKHPVIKLYKAILKFNKIQDMKNELINMGIQKSFIYPEIDKVSEFLKSKYKS